MREISSISAIAFRDFLKFLRDRERIVFSLLFPLVFITILGGSLNASFEKDAGYNLLTFIFIGVLAQTLFQSTAAGIISLIEDRENDFSQEIFVSPVSRYSIIIGKILGESLVALTQVFGLFLIAVITRIPLDFQRLMLLLPFLLVVCLFGGAFGVVILSNLQSQRSANQIFPFIMFPQFFLAGVFNPLQNMPLYISVLSRISPMTYAVDLLRSVYYSGLPEQPKVVLFSLFTNIIVIGILTTIFITLGTFLFIKNERNK